MYNENCMDVSDVGNTLRNRGKSKKAFEAFVAVVNGVIQVLCLKSSCGVCMTELNKLTQIE